MLFTTNKHLKLCTSVLTLGLLFAFPGRFAFALGVGEINITSGLNEPLKAVIPLSASPEELNTLEVQLAPSSAFARAGMERHHDLDSFSFKLIRKGDNPHVRVRSYKPMREPVLEFVLSFIWQNGAIHKDYSIFLSPTGHQMSTQSEP